MYARFQEELDSLWDAYTMHQDTECGKTVNAFGKKMKDKQIEEWQGTMIYGAYKSKGYCCINYKLMNKKVKQYDHHIKTGVYEHRYVLKDFYRIVFKRLFVLYLLEQQGILGSIIAKLAEQQDMPQIKSDLPKIASLREADRDI
ncbi:SPX domain-containing membrane protein [Artemisia annua]|uniref:SPX domain-containing membrane protein n=1 Tax=Artemisia annua TaxID=35608 RepID=A0A2U1QHY1_ARTAN|nr:SPX domain-containing membrane protein [Artemisia annua]